MTVSMAVRKEPSGFNRNIVECKASPEQAIAMMNSGFNRNIVECKEKENEDLKKQTEKF